MQAMSCSALAVIARLCMYVYVCVLGNLFVDVHFEVHHSAHVVWDDSSFNESVLRNECCVKVILKRFSRKEMRYQDCTAISRFVAYL